MINLNNRLLLKHHRTHAYPTTRSNGLFNNEDDRCDSEILNLDERVQVP